MRKVVSLIGLLMLFGSFAIAQEAKTYENTKWGFSVLMPYSIQENPGPNGLGITIASANTQDTIAYMASVFPLAEEVLRTKTQDKILEDAVAGAVANVQGMLLSKRDISLSSYPGKQFVVLGEKFVVNCCIYVAKGRLYLAMVITVSGATLPLSIDAFHASFQIK
jgi:hypothetical protein